MNSELENLAEKLGIRMRFSDAGLQRKDYVVDEKTVKFFVHALGYHAENEEQIKKSLQELEEKRWRHPLQPVYVRTQDNLIIDVVSPDLSKIEIEISDEQGKHSKPEWQYMQNAVQKGLLYKEDLKITTPLAIGYYELMITLAGKKYKTTLAVAPKQCYEGSLADRKLWGFAIQLYALKSKRNWGVGDFTDLSTMVKIAADAKADVIGINPLNTLSHDYPQNASPYSSISRLFLNPIYIDVEKVPEFLPEDKEAIAEELEELRSSELIAYEKIYPLKTEILKHCFDRFEKSKDKNRKQAYEDFCKNQGADLDNLAIFQAVYSDQSKKVWGGCAAWPEEYRLPSSSGIEKFVAENKSKVEFFKYMQFEASRQFAEVAAEIKKCGLKVGLYRDLAVGVGRDSAEYWSNPELFMKKAGTGAPPDAFFPNGQKWGLGTFLPDVLKEKKYLPFIKILRANMQNAGALRIDHVMSLMRLYVIPDAYENGTYLYYPFEDMLNLVALESQLNKCIVVGESIGNVPDGFIDAISAKKIHSLSILWAERWDVGWGDFKQPYDYPQNAFASVATHDIAPLKMWWFGYDIELSFSLGLIETENDKIQAYHKREDDRQKLLSALDKAGVWPEDNQRSGNYIFGEKYPEGIEEAVERFMAKSASPVFLAQLEDILHVEKIQNLPGTDIDKYPNWRLKLPVALEELAADRAYIRCIAAIKKER